MLIQSQSPTQKIKTKKLKLYTPHELQRLMHLSKARYRVSSWGRQSGKTSWAINEIIKAAWQSPGTNYWFIAPTNAQTLVVYRRMVGMLWPCRQIMLKKNQTQHRIKLLNMSSIRCVSGEVFDNLRGETLHGAIVDEVRDQHPDLWPMVIRPMLTTTKGWASFISTPNGFDYFFELFERAESNPDWARWQSPSTANPLFTQDELESARKEMSDGQFRQEIMAEFLDLTAGKAYIFSEANKSDITPFRTSDPDKVISDNLPVVLGMDFNLNPMSWTLGQTDKLKWHWFDEIYLPDSHTQEAADYLVKKLSYYRARGMLRASPQIIVCGDATGKAGQRAAAGKSDYDIVLQKLKSAGFSFVNITPESNPAVRDRVNTVNQKFRSASGEVLCTISPKGCPHLVWDAHRVVWKANGLLDQTRDTRMTHPTDSIGYPMCELTPIKGMDQPGKLRVIVR